MSGQLGGTKVKEYDFIHATFLLSITRDSRCLQRQLKADYILYKRLLGNSVNTYVCLQVHVSTWMHWIHLNQCVHNHLPCHFLYILLCV